MTTIVRTTVDWVAGARKFGVALTTAAATAVTLGLAEGDAAKWVTVGLAFAGAVGVWAVPNATKPR